MKKIKLPLFIAFCFSAIISFSQPGLAWDSAMYNGFGDGENVRCMANDDYGQMYVGTYGGGLNGGIYKTYNARYGSFYRETGFDAMRDAGDDAVAALYNYTPAQKMFVGSNNVTNGGMLYSFDLTNGWVNIPRPSFSFPVIDYPQISKIAMFNLGGADTLYVCWGSIQAGLEIWKTPAANPGSVWVQSYGLGGGSNETVNDLLYFAGRINAQLSNGNMFYSSDGVNWSIDNNSSLGFGDANNIVTGIEIFNGELYAGATNITTGLQIWKTSDLVTWNATVLDGFTNGSNLYQFADIFSHAGKLWVSTVADCFTTYNFAVQNPSGSPQPMGGCMGPLIYSSADGTTFTKESFNALGNLSNSGNWYFGAFNNKTLCYGYNMSWTSSIYTKCIPPVASFVSPSDTTCVGSVVNIGSTSFNNDSLEWFVNGFPYTFSSNMSFNALVLSSNTIKLFAYNGGCVDSTPVFNLEVMPAITIDSIIPQAPVSVCSGSQVTPTLYFSSPPAASFSITWISSVDTLYGQSPIANVITDLSYVITVSNSHGCSATSGYYITALPPANLGGTITYSGGAVNNAEVFVIKIGASSAQYDTVATTFTNAAGVYNFNSLVPGNYILRVEPDTSVYQNTLNTYYGNEYLWDSATVYSHYCDSNITQANIALIEYTPPIGPGSINGVVYEGVGFGQKLIPGPVVMTNVIPGVPVKIGKNPGGAIVAVTITGTPNGDYHFNNLPYDSYKIYTDIPGYPMDSSYAVTLSAGTDSLVNLDYFVDSNSVYIDLASGIHNATPALMNNLVLFPNPAKGFASINFYSDADVNVSVKMMDVSGREVYQKNFGTLKSGNKKLNLDFSASPLAPGIYFVQLNAGNKNYTGKLVVE
ncbi:MAG: T9SS type A sorting domain-containing protein [Bacteroidia bacterium]|nr:T9SS type A sorting domain-containing protein [Bacteroidia bacterium]